MLQRDSFMFLEQVAFSIDMRTGNIDPSLYSLLRTRRLSENELGYLERTLSQLLKHFAPSIGSPFARQLTILQGFKRYQKFPQVRKDIYLNWDSAGRLYVKVSAFYKAAAYESDHRIAQLMKNAAPTVEELARARRLPDALASAQTGQAKLIKALAMHAFIDPAAARITHENMRTATAKSQLGGAIAAFIMTDRMDAASFMSLSPLLAETLNLRSVQTLILEDKISVEAICQLPDPAAKSLQLTLIQKKIAAGMPIANLERIGKYDYYRYACCEDLITQPAYIISAELYALSALLAAYQLNFLPDPHLFIAKNLAIGMALENPVVQMIVACVIMSLAVLLMAFFIRHGRTFSARPLLPECFLDLLTSSKLKTVLSPFNKGTLLGYGICLLLTIGLLITEDTPRNLPPMALPMLPFIFALLGALGYAAEQKIKRIGLATIIHPSQAAGYQIVGASAPAIPSAAFEAV